MDREVICGRDGRKPRRRESKEGRIKLSSCPRSSTFSSHAFPRFHTFSSQKRDPPAMSSPTSSSFDHRPILATSSSFQTHMSPSPAIPTPSRRRVPSSSSNPSSPTTALSSASTLKGSSGGGGGGFSPPFATGGGGWSAKEKGKGKEGGGELEKQQQSGEGGRGKGAPGLAVVIEDVIKTSNGRDKIFVSISASSSISARERGKGKEERSSELTFSPPSLLLSSSPSRSLSGSFRSL